MSVVGSINPSVLVNRVVAQEPVAPEGHLVEVARVRGAATLEAEQQADTEALNTTGPREAPATADLEAVLLDKLA